MTNLDPLNCPDHLLQSLIEASHCTFVLLAMHQSGTPLDVFDVADLLRLDILAADDLVNSLLHLGYITPSAENAAYTISPSGIEMIAPTPPNSLLQLDPTLPDAGDHFLSYYTFDLLPFRKYALLSGKFIGNNLN